MTDAGAISILVVRRGVEHKAATDERAVTILVGAPETKRFGGD